MACVFDPEMFRRTNHRLGYDLCWGPTTRVHDTNLGGMHGIHGMVGGEFNGMGGKFTSGAYVFEDDFDKWGLLVDGKETYNERDPNSMPDTFFGSALWYNATNAAANDKCGSVSGSQSLRFSGKNSRWAETKGLDVRHGGWVNFWLKFGPDGPKASPDCDTAFVGDVQLWYAVEEEDGVMAKNWTRWAEFSPTYYPSDGRWNLERHELPREAWCKATRLRFDQPSFVDRRDHFAIDDLNVFAYFPDNWHKDPVNCQHEGPQFRCADGSNCARTSLRDEVWCKAVLCGRCACVCMHARCGVLAGPRRGSAQAGRSAA